MPRVYEAINETLKELFVGLTDLPMEQARAPTKTDPVLLTKAGPDQSAGFTTAFQISSRMAGRGALAGSFKPGSRRLTAVGGKGKTRQV